MKLDNKGGSMVNKQHLGQQLLKRKRKMESILIIMRDLSTSCLGVEFRTSGTLKILTEKKKEDKEAIYYVGSSGLYSFQGS